MTANNTGTTIEPLPDWTVDEARKIYSYILHGLANDAERADIIEYIAVSLRIAHHKGIGDGLEQAKEVLRSS